MSSRRRAMAATGSLVLSGAACLASQIVIQKYVSVVSGGMDAFIMQTVSLAFLGGLGAGPLISGRFARRERPSALWALVELGCAVGVASFLPLYKALHGHVLAFASAHELVSGYYALVAGLQLATSFVLAALLGANYPLAFEVVSRARGSDTRAVSLVIGPNTIGAALGSLAATLAMPQVSLTTITLAAAGTYALASGLAFVSGLGATRARESGDIPTSPGAGSLDARQAAAILFLLGVVGFGYEAVLLRDGCLRSPGSYATFGKVLTGYLIAWGLGALAALREGKLERTLAGYAIALGLAVALFFPPRGHAVPASLAWLAFAPGLASGCAFGRVHRALESLDARRAAALYVSNLAGSVVGGLLVSHGLNAVGLSFCQALVLLPAGAVAALAVARGARAALPSAVAAVLASVVGLGFEAPARARYYEPLAKIAAPPSVPEGPLGDLAEDFCTSVWTAGDVLYVNGVPQTPFMREPFAGYRWIQTALPLLLEKRARVLFVGVGLGIANGALAEALPESRIENVDYSRALVEVQLLHPDLDFHLHEHPNAPVITTDGRLALLLEHEPLDAVLVFCNIEGTNGMSTIMSVEFLELVKSRLRPGGVLLQHAATPLWVASAQSVFAHVWWVRDHEVFLATDGDLADLLRREPPRDPKAAAMLERLGATRAEVQLLHLGPVTVPRLVRDTDPVADYPLHPGTHGSVSRRSRTITLSVKGPFTDTGR